VRIVAACAFALLLVACQSSQRAAEQAAIREKTTDCLVRESQAVAPQPIDLETAALAVLARCDYPGVIEKQLIAEHPGYREFIHQETQKRYADILDTTKRGIALLRTQGASKQQGTENAH
jgi:hypothetical protein